MSHPLLPHRSTNIALIEAETGRSVRHDELTDLVARASEARGDVDGRLVFLAAAPTIDCVIDVLSLTGSGATIALIDPAIRPDVLDGWVQQYEPEIAIGLEIDAVPSTTTRPNGSAKPADAVLLATSGSTGNPKFVRLSLDNLAANASQIREALDIGSTDRALAHLPLFYSFGLSVLTSHLVAGASVVLTAASAIRAEFWDAMRTHNVTSLPGVPYSFEMFRRMKLIELDLPDLRDVTQAGGRLNPDRVREFADGLGVRDVRLWIMYGQTEATARISVLPADELQSSIGSVGRALPRGSIEIADPDDEGVGEILYSGPNVMLGYATSRSDVQTGDTMGGRLATGDLGRVDASGRLWITGRTKRIAKVFGTRVNLDDVERQLASLDHPLAAVADSDGIAIFVEASIDGFARQCERHLGFPPRSISVHAVDRLPTTSAGKIDYRQLRTP